MEVVGFVGLGKMGLPMALNLLRKGYRLLVVSRSRPPIEKALQAGAEEASSPRVLAERSQAVISCLPDISTLKAVYLGSGGLFEGARPGQLFIDHSTISPFWAKSLFEKARKRGATFLDAPASGGPKGAQSASLSIMVGGDNEAFERARPILEALGKHIVHFGPVGSGSLAKLINNLFVGVLNLTVAEAFFLARMGGLHLEKLYETLMCSTAQSAMLERNFPLIQEEDFSPRFSMEHLLKDLFLLKEAAEELGFIPASLNPTLQATVQAVQEGLGKMDITALASTLHKEPLSDPVSQNPKKAP